MNARFPSLQGFRFFCLFLLFSAGSGLMAGEIKVREIAKGAFSGFNKPVRLVITNATQWAEAWQKHSLRRSPVPTIPEVNFDREIVLFVALGRRNTGGHEIRIENVKEEDGKLVVEVKTRAPAPGGITLQALTAPFHIVAVETRPRPVRFEVDGKPEEPAVKSSQPSAAPPAED